VARREELGHNNLKRWEMLPECCGRSCPLGDQGRSLSKLGITRTASQVENGKTVIKGLLPGTVRIEDVLH